MKYQSLAIAALLGFITVESVEIRALGDDNAWGEALDGADLTDYSKDTPQAYAEEKKKAPKPDAKAIARQKKAEQALVE